MLGKRAIGEKIIHEGRHITLEEFVESHWLAWLTEEVTIGNLKQGTASWYRGGANHVIRELGRFKLSKIGKPELRAMLARRIEADDSPHMLRWIRATTRSILGLAVELDLIPSDPTGFLVGKHAPKVLKKQTKPPMAWSREEAQQFLSAIEGDPLECLWIVLLTTGLRRGEALALTWDDIDLEGGTLSVSKALVQVRGVPTLSTPKTASSHRTIAIGETTVAALRDQRVRQLQTQLASSDWKEKSIVFANSNGGHIRPDTAYRRFKRLVHREGLPWIKLHGLRHTMASLALQGGVDVATVSERLGHADVGITTRTYLHGSIESDRRAADQLDAALNA